MSVPLAIVVRVLDKMPREMLPAPLDENDIMLDPWVEFPMPRGTPVEVTPGKLPLPDVPYIPRDDDDQ
jgi:hypothetical protein